MNQDTTNHEIPESMDYTSFDDDMPGLGAATKSTLEEAEPVLEHQFPTTPRTTVGELFETNQFTPPQTTFSKRLVDEIAAEWNSLPKNTSRDWSTLTEIEQVKAAFLLIKEQPELIQKDQNCKIEHLIEAVLDPESTTGKRLEAFVRKGGDQVVSNSDQHDSKFSGFLDKHGEWGGEKSETKVTLFDLGVEPYLRYQQPHSTICYAVVVANAIYYFNELRRVKSSTTGSFFTDTDEDKEESKYKHINVSRYMRNRFSNEEVFSNIFRGAGGHLVPELERLLQEQNVGETVSAYLPLYVDAASLTFAYMSHTLQKSGALMIEGFKVTTALLDSDEVLFHVPWRADQSENSPNPNHAVLVVGVRFVNDDLEFLIQNSWEFKPFFVVSLTTLKSMGIKGLYAIPEGIRFRPCELTRFEEEPILGTLTSGSPRHGILDDRLEIQTRQWENEEHLPKNYYAIKAGPGTSIRT